MIFTNSRYRTADQVRVVDAYGITRTTLYRKRPIHPRRVRYTEYRAREGERLDTLANRFYQDSTLWWKIVDANFVVMKGDNIVLTRSLVLRIPSADPVLSF